MAEERRGRGTRDWRAHFFLLAVLAVTAAVSSIAILRGPSGFIDLRGVLAFWLIAAFLGYAALSTLGVHLLRRRTRLSGVWFHSVLVAVPAVFFAVEAARSAIRSVRFQGQAAQVREAFVLQHVELLLDANPPLAVVRGTSPRGGSVGPAAVYLKDAGGSDAFGPSALQRDPVEVPPGGSVLLRVPLRKERAGPYASMLVLVDRRPVGTLLYGSWVKTEKVERHPDGRILVTRPLPP